MAWAHHFVWKAETKWRWAKVTGASGRDTSRAAYFVVVAISLMLLFCFAASIFFWVFFDKWKISFRLFAAAAAARENLRAENLSDVCSWNEFNFLLFGGCQTNTHTHSSRSTTSRKSRRCRQATPAADNTSSGGGCGAQLPYFPFFIIILFSHFQAAFLLFLLRFFGIPLHLANS